jgi:hypothetical protein
LTGVGSIVSFIVTLLLHILLRKLQRQRALEGIYEKA